MDAAVVDHSTLPEHTLVDDVEMLDSDPKHDDQEDDLFGNDGYATRDGLRVASEQSGEASDRVSTPEQEHRRALEYEEEEEPGGVLLQVKEATVQIPNIPFPTSTDRKNWVIRLPNFVKVDSKPFHPDSYAGPEHDDDELQHGRSIREKSMTIKLKVENTLRWRWIKDNTGNDRRQSNSRIIRWSDGSLSLRLGKELFDIKQSVDISGGISRTPLTPQPFQQSQSQQSDLSQSQSQSQPPPLGSKSQGLTYLVAQHKHSEVLQSEALITGYMTLTPTGMQSETHRMLVRAVGQRHNKIARLRMAPDPITDPEREKMELIKQSAKKSKKRADLDDGLGAGRKKRLSYTRKRSTHDLWSDDGEEDRHDVGTDDEDDDGPGSSKGGSPKKKRTSIDERKGAGEYQEDDFLVPDSSDEDAGAHRKKRKSGEDVTEDDPLDKLDAQIEEQEQRQQRSGATRDDDGKPAEDDHQEMDVESEEDEEEFNIRRAGGTSGRKKKAINFDNDDDD